MQFLCATLNRYFCASRPQRLSPPLLHITTLTTAYLVLLGYRQWSDLGRLVLNAGIPIGLFTNCGSVQFMCCERGLTCSNSSAECGAVVLSTCTMTRGQLDYVIGSGHGRIRCCRVLGGKNVETRSNNARDILPTDIVHAPPSLSDRQPPAEFLCYTARVGVRPVDYYIFTNGYTPRLSTLVCAPANTRSLLFRSHAQAIVRA